MEEIEANNIKIYALPDCDPDEDEFYKEKVRRTFQFLLNLRYIVKKYKVFFSR